ncbi:serine/threonine protein phosphatase [Paramagnetospirillum kuznetsovii]|uniref:Serine/threonine protein phosphatase n=1 Tax=Paramagnetospirillum kuznetsovii TaxID=2053833 RepID=A0A364NU31_9PROT|nr:SpoIIE family protein phosphatase [Paramagnetospirillum kuznetsovii]RAU20377.1 serine/threonine protein phosphatase [Paramagnetospirillum kuznetsovii]
MIQQRLRVLLIEDNPGDAHMVKTVLKEVKTPGFIVMHESTLTEAIERLKVSAAFDVLLLDLGLPDSHSSETLGRLQEAITPLPIVIMTGNDDPLAAEHAIEAGAQDYVIKGELDGRSLSRTLLYAIYRFRSDKERLALAEMLAVEYDRMAEELSTARNMQFHLLPSVARLDRIRSTYGLSVDGFFKPSSDIGGDLWGCLEGEDGRLVVYALDFSGHGVGAALNVFRLHTLISELKEQIANPAATLQQLNSTLRELLPRGQYATIVLAVIDTVAGTMTWSGAGAPRPILFDPSGNTQWVDTSGPPLGLQASAKYFNRQIAFPPGCCLFIYSDAMTEAVIADGEMFEDERLLDLVRRHHTPAGGIGIAAMAAQFLDQVETPLGDDMTAVSIAHIA